MMIDPCDEDDGKAQGEREERWAEMAEGKPQLPSRTDVFRRRNLDVDDQERKRDGKNAIAKNLEPCVGVRICHLVVAVSVYAVAVMSLVRYLGPRGEPTDKIFRQDDIGLRS